MKRLFDKTFLKFIFAGVINTAVGAAVMFSCYNLLKCSYWFSSAANYVVGSIVSYFLNKYYTFNVKKRSWKYIAKFVANISVCYLVAYGIAKPLAMHLLEGMTVKVQENAAMLFGMCIFVILNYIGQRYFAFRDGEKRGG